MAKVALRRRREILEYIFRRYIEETGRKEFTSDTIYEWLQRNRFRFGLKRSEIGWLEHIEKAAVGRFLRMLMRRGYIEEVAPYIYRLVEEDKTYDNKST